MSREACENLWSLNFKGSLFCEWKKLEPLLQDYIRLLLKRTESTNLISKSQRSEEAVWLHILDCLHALHLVDPAIDKSILDAGSGCGMPGIMLAAALPSSRHMLLDRSSTRAEFLEYAVATLNLRNTTVLCSELSGSVIEDAAPGLITLRAFENVEKKNPFKNLPAKNCDWMIFATKQNETIWMERVAQPELTLKQRLSYDLPQKAQTRLLLRFTAS